MSRTLLFVAEFTKSKVKTTPANAPTIDIADKLAPTGALLVSAGSPTQFTNMTGVYVYSYSAADSVDPVGVMRTADTTVDLQDIPCNPIPLGANGNVKSGIYSILGTLLSETGAGYLAGSFIKFFDKQTPTGTINSIPDAVAGAASGIAIVGSNMGTVTTATNLTNAPANGDFTAAMKTSLNNATPAVTVSDKTGFSLSTAGILAIWHQLTAAIVTAGSIGKLLVDNINATIGSRSTLTSANVEDAVWDATLANHLDAGSTGEALDDSATSSAPTVGQIDAQLSATHGAGLWGGTAGTGFYTVQIPTEVSGIPADGVQVQVTNDITGLNIVAQAISDTNGIATVFLDAGDYYVFLQRGGDTFPNPTLITVP